jgi:hypothetical protein
MIWKLSFPGPRVLGVSDRRRFPDKLYFRENENHPNPAALSACQESRAVALKHYHLCFGTSNVYADLTGGDILYFGPSWGLTTGHLLRIFGGLLIWEERDRQSRRWVNKELTNAVKADLDQVTHIAISYHTWSHYTRFGRIDPYANDLRDDVKPFSRLKQLLLVANSPSNCTPGYVSFKDRTLQHESFRFVSFEDFQKDFLHNWLNSHEKEMGVPDLKLVTATRITHIPGDDWERDKGEPFVRVPTLHSVSFFVDHHSQYLPEPAPKPSIEPR